MNKILIIMLLAFCSLGSFGQTRRTAKKPARKKTIAAQTQKNEQMTVSNLSKVTDEDYGIYMAILGKDSEMFVVRDKSSVDDFGGNGNEFLKENFEELKSETIENFKSKNKDSSNLDRKFPTTKNYILISDEQLKKFFNGKLDWEGFHKKYPESSGFYSFSKVGFSKDNSQALVFVAFSCGGLCGEGNYYFLKNENGEWKVIKKQMTWIS